MKQILDHAFDRKFAKVNGGRAVIVTHSDMDGLVSAIQVKTAIIGRLVSEVVVASDITIGVSTTDELVHKAASTSMLGLGLPEGVSALKKGDYIFILDRPPVTELFLTYINPDVHIICIDHHESSIDKFAKLQELHYNSSLYIDTDKHWSAATLVNLFIKDVIPEFYDKNIYSLLAKHTTWWDTFLWTELPKDKQEIALKIQSLDKVFDPIIIWRHLAYLGDISLRPYELVEHLFNIDTGLGHFAYTTFMTKLRTLFNGIAFHLHQAQRITVRSKDNPNITAQFVVLYVQQEYQSLVAHKLFTETDIQDDGVIFINYYGTISIRTRDTSPIKANKIAETVGGRSGNNGGGHPNAAGATMIKRIDLEQRLLKTLSSYLDEGVIIE